MPTNEQRRQAAKRKLERQIVRRAERAKRRRTVAVSVTIATVVVVVVGVYLIATVGGGDDQQAAAANPTETETETSDAAAPNTTGGPCAYTATPNEPAAKPVELPADPTPTTNTGTVKVSLKTNQGDVPLTLDRAAAPCTVQSIEHLVRSQYYDNTPCHRLTASSGLKVLQCGDPTGQGTGGPGYTINDEPPTNLQPAAGGAVIYPRGTLAMAKTSAPNSGGSQFFLVYGDSTLPPDYTVFGTVGPEGLATLDAIAQGGSDDKNGPGDGAPRTPVTIQTATAA